MLCTKPSDGYYKCEVTEPLVLEEDDYRTEPEKWNIILELCGFRPDYHVSRIVLNISTVEFFVEKEKEKND